MMSSRRRERAGIEANLTSLIDVTFLLIVFFVLVSKLNEVESVELDLPSPADAATVVLKAEHQVVVSVLPAPGGQVAGYRAGIVDFASDKAGQEALIAHLAGLYRSNARIDVNIRADRPTHYEHIEPAIRAVSTAARAAAAASGQPQSMARVNLMVTREN